MNIAMDNNNQWNHESSNFAAMDSNDYEKAFESYISDVDDEDEDFNADYSRLYQPEQHQHHDENQQINEIFIEIPPPNIRLDLCPVCSRRFAPETLLKHVMICERINTKSRKPFDSSRQRLKGTEFVASAPTETRVSPPKTFLQRKPSVTSLKSQPAPSIEPRHIPLDNMSRKSSTISLASNVSRPVAKRSTSQPSPEKCPYCERVFGFKAYDRHVEWCKEKSLIKPNPDPRTVSIAKERLKTRIGYKAPNLKTKRGVTREKYSTSCNGSTNSLADFDSTINSMTSSFTSENGNYDPFLSAKKQLEELFSPTTPTPSTKMINSMMTTPSSGISNNKHNKSNNDIMSKSFTSQTISPKTPQPIPKMQSNFRRTSSLRISNRKPKPVYTPPIKSNVHCGITDDGPISPNFVKATDYDELPIKSPYSAIQLVEKAASPPHNLLRSSQSPSPSPTLPVFSNNSNTNNNINSNKPVLMRDKGNGLFRKNLKLDLKNPNMPSADYPLSKTDSLALFLKYESELSSQLSEKDLKDKSNNSLSKRSTTNFLLKDQKLPDINGKTMVMKPQPKTNGIVNNYNHLSNMEQEKELISIDKLNTSLQQQSDTTDSGKSHSAPLKLINACDNLPLLSNNNNISDKSRSPSLEPRESPEKMTPGQSNTTSRRSGSALRRQKKYDMNNILFDTEPAETMMKTTPPSSSDNSKNNSLIRPDSRTSNTESIFEDFDFDQFIASFTDDEKFPIFKDYKMLLNKSVKADEENNNNHLINNRKDESKNIKDDIINNVNNNNIASRPIPIQQNQNQPPQQQQQQQQQKTQNDMTGMEKLDNLCKMLSGNSDSDESNSFETDPSESQTTRSKSSADSAYGSLSRQSQSPLDYRKIPNHSNGNANYIRPPPSYIPPPVPPRQHLELKTTEIVLSPVKAPAFQETIMIPKNGNPQLGRSMSNSDEQANDALKLSKFCHMCGYKFVVATAKFCIECGVRRIKV
ncbi:myb-like protein AA isoform X2 [Chironomus tepperi]|uniref:myb-like protein AA isoform X2 n=1 Tax=Chironomus tepperi TaxID=113505 RepID=UPI00391F8099